MNGYSSSWQYGRWFWASFVGLEYRSRFAASIIVIAIGTLITWSFDFVCPRCGHGVGGHPMKWLHNLPSQAAWDVFYRRCRWCGHDLRA
jgi:hypothetical protein